MLLLAAAIATSVHAHIVWDAPIIDCDLVFCGVTEHNAITQVTTGYEGLKIDHVGIAHRIGGDNGPLYIIEARPQRGVCLTPLDSFVVAAMPHDTAQQLVMVVGRIVPTIDRKASIARALHYVGRPYDDLFLPNDSAIYCSELVQLSIVDPQNRLVFAPIPMTFGDGTAQVTPYWKEYYARRGMQVPDGEPGTNPGELSRRPEVKIVHRITDLSNW